MVLTGLLALWALGTAASEGLLQGAADATVLFALGLLLARRVRLSEELRWPVLAGGALALYQALSPLLVHLAGVPEWPPLGRWLQCLDTAAAPGVALAAAVGVHWAVVEGAAVASWTGSVAVGLVQHLVRWEVPLSPLLRLPVDRVHEVFAPEGRPRFAAGGFFFHRLRFAHGAVALLGPALAASLRAVPARRRWLAAWLALLCALAVYLSYARAALGAVVLLGGAAGLFLSRRWARRAGLAGVLLLCGAVALAPGWRLRLADAGDNLFAGERAVARAAGWDLVRRHPLLGVGFGNYHAAALSRAPETGLPALLARDAHALWLTTWAETGVLGLLLWLAWQLLLARALWQRARAGAWPAAGALLSWGAFHALGLVHHLPFHSSVHLTFALVWGVGLVYPGGATLPVASPKARPAGEETAEGAGWVWRPALAETGLLLWGVGVQLSEALGALGMVLSLAAVFPPGPGWRARAAWPLWAFVAWCLLAPLLAGHVPTAAGLARILDWCFLPAAAAALGCLGPPARRRLAVAVGAVFLLSCAAALCQHWGLWPQPDTFARFRWTGLPFQRVYEPIPGQPSRYMAGGLLLHRLKFAHVGALLVLAYLDLGLLRRSRAALAVAVAGALCVVWLPHARAAAVALVLSVALVLGLRLSARWRWPASLGVLCLGAALLASVPSLRMRFVSAATDEGSRDRRWLAQTALRAVAQHPLAGVGLGRYHPAQFSSADTPEEVVRHAGKAHNQYLTLAAEAGLPAALLYLLVLLFCWRAVRPAWPLGAAARASLVFLALVSLLHDPLFHAEVSMAVVLTLGLSQGVRRKGGDEA